MTQEGRGSLGEEEDSEARLGELNVRRLSGGIMEASADLGANAHRWVPIFAGPFSDLSDQWYAFRELLDGTRMCSTQP